MELELNKLVDALPGLVWTAMADGSAEYLGRGWLEYTGLTSDAAVGTGWRNAVHPEDLPRLDSDWAAIIASGEAGNAEARLRRFDGEYRWFLIRAGPMPDAAGGVARWCAMNIDIQERRQAEQALAAQAHRFRGVLEGLPAIVGLFEPTGAISYSNRYMLEYLGRTLDELKTGLDGHTYHPDDRAEVLQRWTTALGAGRPLDVEARILRRDGTYRWHRVRGIPLRDADGQIELWHGLFTDIHEARRAGEILAGERQLLEFVALGRPLGETLEALCQQVERLAPTCTCCLLLPDGSKEKFELVAAPAAAARLSALFEGALIDPAEDPCSFAAVDRTPVLIPDVSADARWAGSPWSSRLAALGYTSVCAVPILSKGESLLGLLAVLRASATAGTAGEQEFFDRLAQIGGIAIERAHSDRTLRANEAELRRAHRQLTEAQRLSHTGSFTADIVADEHSWSEELYPIFGIDPGTRITLDKVLKILHPEDLPAFEVAFGRALSGASDFEHAFRVLTPDGGVKHLHCAAHHLQTEDGPVFVGAIQDITQSRIAEQALQASEQALRLSEAELRRALHHLTAAQRLSRTGSFTWDVEDDEHNWSEEIYRIFALEPGSKVTLEVIQTQIHPEDVAAVGAVIGGAFAGKGFDLEFRLLGQAGLRHVRVVGRPIGDFAPRNVFVGAIQDITENKTAEEALNRARAELAHVTRITALSALTASIAHEVNQPLLGIVTNASTCLRMLAADPPNIEGARATAQRTIRDGHRASEVIQRLRGLFARRPPGKLPVDLNEAAREVLALSAGDLQRRGVTVRAQLADDLPEVVGDRVQLQQVILNLVLNAADAMSDVDDRPRELTITTSHSEGGEAALSVTDSGVGLSPEIKDRLFDAFYTTKAEGMGIGLSISRSIIESHEGRLWAEANPDHGATFTFTMPYQNTDAAGGRATEVPELATPRGSADQ